MCAQRADTLYSGNSEGNALHQNERLKAMQPTQNFGPAVLDLNTILLETLVDVNELASDNFKAEVLFNLQALIIEMNVRLADDVLPAIDVR